MANTTGPGNDKYTQAAKSLADKTLVRVFEATGVDFDDKPFSPKVEQTLDPNADIYKLGSKSGEQQRLGMAILVLDDKVDLSQVSVALGNTAAAMDALAKKEQEEKREQEHKDRVFQMLLEQYRWHDQKAKEHADHKEAIKGLIAKINRGEKIELKPDGSLKDPKEEAAVRDYEQKTGSKIDRTNPEELRKVEELHKQKETEHRQKAREYKAEAEKVSQMAPEQAAKKLEEISEKSGFERSSQITIAIEDKEKQIGIIEKRNFSDITKQASVDAVNGSYFSEESEQPLTIGSNNPITKGDASKLFASAAKPIDEEKIDFENEKSVSPSQAPGNTA
jgi:hypothetical protein